VVEVHCGAQFSLALTKSGQIFTWGKGDYFRLGTGKVASNLGLVNWRNLVKDIYFGKGTDQHFRKPTLVESLKGKRIVSVAVGALHSLAVSDKGEVWAWGWVIGFNINLIVSHSSL